ncbi:hypothetical protein G4V62_03855 [Bacillaceae bacterium SIJ1]|uniref:FliH/SctL family protein n=1 Tax=Litoribacterium kuwaitense TaxID=1398745 RepID=UPI0013EAB7BD|nr:FliH/SctL family protein [Litoribacterium kuwaitense]NGP44127.1 hypothetical protein [Litoribacterium kuwaitense]
MSKKLAIASDIVESLTNIRSQTIEQAEEDIAALAFAVASRVTRQAAENMQSLRCVVSALLKEVKEADVVKLYVSPEQYLFVSEQQERVKKPGQDLLVYPDDDLQFGDCYLETSNGRIDASVDSQLNEIRKALELTVDEVEAYDKAFERAHRYHPEDRYLSEVR